jgi:hypothetical protein
VFWLCQKEALSVSSKRTAPDQLCKVLKVCEFCIGPLMPQQKSEMLLSKVLACGVVKGNPYAQKTKRTHMMFSDRATKAKDSFPHS